MVWVGCGGGGVGVGGWWCGGWWWGFVVLLRRGTADGVGVSFVVVLWLGVLCVFWVCVLLLFLFVFCVLLL